MRTSFPTLVVFVCALPLAIAQDFRELGASGLVPVRGSDWRDVAAGDLDGDGDRDLVFACYGVPGIGERNFWLRNDGSGVFETMPASELQLAPSLSSCVLLADFDGDGDLDAFFGNQRFDSLCRNDGTGRLVLDPNALPLIDRDTAAAAYGDVDGDGDLDVVVACGGNEILYRNTGNGVFVDASASLPTAWTNTRGVDLGDYDGDGDLDVLLVHADAPSELWWNDGTGSFVLAGATLPTGVWCTAGDVDGDGDRDLWLGYLQMFSTLRGRLYRNDGGGSFTWVQTTPPGFGQPSRLADLDGDGDLDLAIPGQAVWNNDGAGTFAPGPSQPTLGHHFADIDGDGDLDQIGEPTFRNDGTGSFVIEPWFDVLPADRQNGALLAVDFDRDGDPDLVQRRGFPATVVVLGNDGRGVFRGLLAQLSDTNGVRRAADLNGDSYPDLLAEYANFWVENLAGTGMQQRPLPTTVIDVFPIDADGDADLDLIARTNAGPVQWFANNAATFAPGQPALPGSAVALLGIADLDGDGRSDVLWRDSSNGLSGSRCTGNGVFTTIVGMLPVGTLPTAALVAADLDGDGDTDLALGHGGAAAGPNRVTLLANDGSGHFTVAATGVPIAVLDAVDSIEAADLDGDGDLDLVVQSYTLGSRLLRNDGAFGFVDATGTGLPWQGLAQPSTRLAIAGDIDRDGDVDFVALGSVRVLRNLQRQLIARSAPRIGANWRLEVLQRPVGSSAGGVVLGIAEPVPGLPTPFGELRIDPLGAVLYPLVPINAVAPVPALTLPVPNTPSLRGLALFAQHVVFDGAALRLGNQLAAVVE